MEAHIVSEKRRFEALLGNAISAAHDQPLLERREWVVAPTLGAIVPNWLLAIPRRPALNFRDWAATGGERAETVLHDIRKHLGLASKELIWFEHGPAIAGTTVGCGLDHAHLHILLRPTFTFTDFVARARGLARLNWQEGPVECGYVGLDRNASYYIAGCGDRVITASHVEGAGSQFFRRIVGSLTGHDAEWDYRKFPHVENITRTIRAFRSLERAAQRDQ